MRIDTIMRRRRTLSFEVFPPRPDADPDLSGIRRTLSELRQVSPDFVSVTYGAGGSNKGRALEIADTVISLGMSPLSHLTAVCAHREVTDEILGSLEARGVENVLALRGDVPIGMDPSDPACWPDFKSGRDIAAHVAAHGAFSIGCAAYPEGHGESISPERDIEIMLDKSRAGASFFITQLFFDNDIYFRFCDMAERMGVGANIAAGVMPVLSASRIERIVEISGCRVPPKLASLLDRYRHDDASMRDAGIDWAAEQISSLWEAGRSVHVYTMNKYDSVLEIMRRCGFC